MALNRRSARRLCKRPLFCSLHPKLTTPNRRDPDLNRGLLIAEREGGSSLGVIRHRPRSAGSCSTAIFDALCREDAGNQVIPAPQSRIGDSDHSSFGGKHSLTEAMLASPIADDGKRVRLGDGGRAQDLKQRSVYIRRRLGARRAAPSAFISPCMFPRL